MQRDEQVWKSWWDHNEPEMQSVPGYEDRIQTEKEIGKFIHLSLIRCLREDRTVIFTSEFISTILSPDYAKPVTDSTESIWLESSNRVPILYLLSSGADPTSNIDEFAKKKKKYPTDKVSMGEGQEIIALNKIRDGFLSGSWVILQNCHLGLGFMAEIEGILGKAEQIEDDFRLWITCESTPKFPIGLLQMSIKVTNEPPKGLKAGLQRTFSTIVSPDTLEKHDTEKWRMLLYCVCFLHSIV